MTITTRGQISLSPFAPASITAFAPSFTPSYYHSSLQSSMAMRLVLPEQLTYLQNLGNR